METGEARGARGARGGLGRSWGRVFFWGGGKPMGRGAKPGDLPRNLWEEGEKRQS